MAEIKVGEVVLVRTTGEPAFVLAINTVSPKVSLSSALYGTLEVDEEAEAEYQDAVNKFYDAKDAAEGKPLMPRRRASARTRAVDPQFTLMATVRLPKESKDYGISHNIASFFVQELESRDDRDKRQFDEFLNLTKQSQASPVVMDTEKMGVRN